MQEDIEKILFDEETIARRVAELGKALNRDYAGKNPLVICILKGAVIFFSDLIRRMEIPVEPDFMAVSSYGSGSRSSGNVRIVKDTDSDVKGRDVIIVEDIVDSGNSLFRLTQLLRSRGASSVKVCAFLDKKARRAVPMEADYTGFEIEDAFVVGYGLDYAERYRNLPFIGVLKKSVYEN